MPIETIPGTDIRYYLVVLDEKGTERPDDPDGRMQERIAQAINAEHPTDVFTFIHGWKGDLPAARTQYAAWMSTLMAQTGDIERATTSRPGFVPLLVGLHWPSLPFGEESFGRAESFGIGADDAAETEIDWAARTIADTPAARQALQTIFAAAQAGYAPVSLPADVAAAYRLLDQEAGLGANGIEGDPGADRESFDPDAAYARALEEPISFGGGGLGNALLSPLVQLSFWKMKKRAKRIGESGGFALLSALMELTKDRDVRFHLMGHSFGCIAASASACGPADARLPRPVHSLVLVQGALSLWSCCDSLPGSPTKAGYFRRLAASDVVAGAVVTTRSDHDLAVGSLYPVAAGMARQVDFAPGAFPKYGGVGTFGLRGSGLDIEDLDVQDPDFAYGFVPGRIYNVNCSRVIREGSPPSGAHSDIARPEVGHLVWAAAMGP